MWPKNEPKFVCCLMIKKAARTEFKMHEKKEGFNYLSCEPDNKNAFLDYF